jgi:aminocarboxymuconate-semialdehyde decarboxylase
MLIDIHHHYVPQRFIDLVRKDGEKYQSVVYKDATSGLESLAMGTTEIPPDRPIGRSLYAMDPGIYDLATHVQEMAEMGLDMAALSASPLLYYYDAEAALGLEVSQIVNDSIHEAAQQHPDRFVGLGTVPLQDVDAAIGEMERCAKEYGFTGVEIGGSVNGQNLDAPEFDAFFQRAEALDQLIFIHPMANPSPDRLTRYYTENCIALPLESGICANSLINGGTLMRYPNIKICFAHGGGIAPSLIGRWDHTWEVREEPKVVIDEPPSTYFKKLYFDDLVHSAAVLQGLVTIVGADRVVIGTDYNYDMGQYPPAEHRLDGVSLTTDERDMIEHKTAARLLRIEDRIS